MPWRPKSHAALTHSRQPTDHAYAQERRAVHGPDPRSTPRWRRVRARVLARGPLCADPFFIHARTGAIVPATEVDHRQGIWERPDLVFAEENLQALCRACHARKSAAERQTGQA